MMGKIFATPMANSGAIPATQDSPSPTGVISEYNWVWLKTQKINEKLLAMF